MGNCQAAEVATVVIQHPGNKLERIYCSASASDVMKSNPGHYVALICETGGDHPVRQLKLLRPDDDLLLGQVYRLISFEDVLKDFAAKKSVRLGKVLQEGGVYNVEPKKKQSRSDRSSDSKPSNPVSTGTDHNTPLGINNSSGGGSCSMGGGRGLGRHHIGGGGQWRPALHSIAEMGT